MSVSKWINTHKTYTYCKVSGVNIEMLEVCFHGNLIEFNLTVTDVLYCVRLHSKCPDLGRFHGADDIWWKHKEMFFVNTSIEMP